LSRKCKAEAGREGSETRKRLLCGKGVDDPSKRVAGRLVTELQNKKVDVTDPINSLDGKKGLYL